jgi:hypothetical protein
MHKQKLYLWPAVILISILATSRPTFSDTSSSAPSVEDWRWYIEDFRMTMKMIHWNRISGSFLEPLNQMQTASEIDADEPVTPGTPCLRRSPGAHPRCTILQIRKGDNVSTLSDVSELRHMIGTIDSEKKAVAFLSLTVPCLHSQGDLLNGWVGTYGNDYFILASGGQTLFACNDPSIGVLYRVTSEGNVRLLADQLNQPN